MQHRAELRLSWRGFLPRRRRERRESPRPLRLCGLAFSLLLSISLQAQSLSEIFVRAFSTHDSVLLRWVPANVETWKLGNKHGYIIERFLQSEYPNGKATLISSAPIFPLAKTDSLWNKLIRADQLNAFVFESLYGEKQMAGNAEKRKLEEQTRFGFVLKAGDLSIETAKAEGLYFCDKTISPGQNYVYRISILSNAGEKTSPFGIAIADEKLSILNFPEQMKAEFGNKKATLTFNVTSTREQYAGYIVERSEDSLHFMRINSTLLTFAKSQYELSKTELVYQDSFPQNHKRYWYRVRGYSYFGFPGPPSASVSGKGREEWTAFPLIDTLFSPDNQRVEMKWRWNEKIDSSQLKNFLVLRATNANGKYDVVNKNFLGKNNFSFTDHSPTFANYYKIAAISVENDTAFSFPYFFQLKDNEPPPIPEKITGTIDSNGIAHVHWEKVNATDLKGYRVFRCNSLQEEFIEVSDSILPENNFTDTITLHTLTRQVYYCVRSVDRMYNNSQNSFPCRLARPDKIAPVPALVKSIVHTDTTIELKWINSSSDDVKCMELSRHSSAGETIQLFTLTGKDTIQEFSDSLLQLGMDYNYVLTTIDSSGNRSIAEFPTIHFQPHIYPALKNISAIPDFEKRTITLSWQSPETNVDRYVIYKSKKGEQLRIWKTVSGNISSVVDRELYPGNTYVYEVKAVMKNGSETRVVRMEVVY